MKFRKKPVVIDAIQLTNTNIKEVYEFVHNKSPKISGWEQYEISVVIMGMDITTLEDGVDNRAKHVASIGDWIIKGVQGEFYPCKPEIFELTYEEVK